VSAAPLAVAGPAPAAVARGWLQSPAFDLACFTLSPLAGLFVLWAHFNMPGGAGVIAAATYLVAIPHYVSSFTFFLGDDNLAHYRSRRFAFFVGPVLIIGAVVALRGLGIFTPVLVAMFVWNVWHVSLQSAGILSLYRRLGGGPQEERPAAHLAILATNAAMAFWFVDRFPPLYGVLVAIHPFAPLALRAITLPVAAGALGVLAWRLARRPRAPSFAEGAFLASSLALFHPYLWVDDANLATFGMLMGHFIQYLAIVWLLHGRKYAASHGSTHERVLGRIASQPVLLVTAIAGCGIVFYLANHVSAMLGAPQVYIAAWNALTLVHFYLDGLIWAFKNPYVRSSIGPYLTPSTRMAAR
jgi:hypothetical protein